MVTGILSAAVALQAAGFAAAKTQAAAEKKVLYVLISAPECKWCRRFKAQTLSDAGVQSKLRQMAVVVEAERGSGDYPDALEAARVPMHYFLAPDERILVKMPGYWGIEDFMSILDEVERKRN